MGFPSKGTKADKRLKANKGRKGGGSSGTRGTTSSGGGKRVPEKTTTGGKKLPFPKARPFKKGG